MKTQVLLLFLVICTVHINALKTEKSRNTKEVYHKKHMDDLQEKLNKLKLMEEELEEEIRDDGDYDDDDEEEEEEDEEDKLDYDAGGLLPSDDQLDFIYDPCAKKHCGPGRECEVSEDGEGVCQCVSMCDVPDEDRRRVCSNHNETWPSDCELYRQRCLCTEESMDCQDEQYKHVHIDYYGQCQEIEECSEGDREDFGRRLTEWLFSVMRDMADRNILSKHYTELEKEAERSETKKWTYSVVWKWCELDGHPRDRAVSRHELFPLRAPLYTLEHCVAPFLDSCDADDDHSITLNEWIACLKIENTLAEDLEELCEEIRD